MKIESVSIFVALIIHSQTFLTMEFEKFGFRFSDQGEKINDDFFVTEERYDLIDEVTRDVAKSTPNKSTDFLAVLEAIDPQNIQEVVAAAYYLGYEHRRQMF